MRTVVHIPHQEPPEGCPRPELFQGSRKVVVRVEHGQPNQKLVIVLSNDPQIERRVRNAFGRGFAVAFPEPLLTERPDVGLPVVSRWASHADHSFAGDPLVDVAFLVDLTEELAQNFPEIDREHVYLFGVDCGADLAWDVLMTAGGAFSGVAIAGRGPSVAGREDHELLDEIAPCPLWLGWAEHAPEAMQWRLLPPKGTPVTLRDAVERIGPSPEDEDPDEHFGPISRVSMGAAFHGLIDAWKSEDDTVSQHSSGERGMVLHRIRMESKANPRAVIQGEEVSGSRRVGLVLGDGLNSFDAALTFFAGL